MIGGGTRLVGLIGHPVEHSLSPQMHNAAFSADGLNYVYVAMDVDPADLEAAVRGAAALGFRGFNVTMPHKQSIVPLLGGLDGAARISGAVNTVVIEGSNLYGYNTDGSGMVEACRESGAGLAGRRILLLGAGGVAAAISFAAAREGAGELRIINRNPERAEDLARKLREAVGETRISTHSVGAIEEALQSADVVVNATSLGMDDGDPLPLPAEHLYGSKVVCDAVYRPGGETPLVREARKRDVHVVPGERMLLYQGVEAQRLWTGAEPNVEAMDRAIS